MSDLKKDAAHWRGKINELIKVIYQVKDGALQSPFGEHAQWHAKLSNVTAELGLLAAWLARLDAAEQHDDK
jgi:hypothetical protein